MIFYCFIHYFFITYFNLYSVCSCHLSGIIHLVQSNLSIYIIVQFYFLRLPSGISILDLQCAAGPYRTTNTEVIIYLFILSWLKSFQVCTDTDCFQSSRESCYPQGRCDPRDKLRIFIWSCLFVCVFSQSICWKEKYKNIPKKIAFNFLFRIL